MKKLVLLFSLIALIYSCGPKKSEFDALKSQNDSLMLEKHRMQDEVDSYFASMNKIEQNIAQIKEQEGLISTRTSNVESGSSSDIELDLQSIQQILEANRSELDRLKQQVQKSTLRSTELEKTIARLTREVEEHKVIIAQLGKEITHRDSLIKGMNLEIVSLVQNVETLQSDNAGKNAKINEQENTIHSAWYVFGTSKELKAQKIISGGGLFSSTKIMQSDFNKEYFVKVDYRNTHSISLYSKKAKVLTNHPKSAYSLNKGSEGYSIVITNPELFWSISKYLVIEVD